MTTSAARLTAGWSAGSAAATLAVVAVCWGAFAMGGAHPWGYWPLAAICVGAGTVGLTAERRTGGTDRLLFGGLATVTVAIALQLVPLPLAWITALSPHLLPLLANVDFAYGAGLVQRHPLSVDPPSTVVALALFVSFATLMLGLTRAFATTHLRRTVQAIGIAGVVLAIAAIVQKPFYEGKVLGMWEPEAGASPFGPFVNKNHFAGWMLMALPMTMGLLCVGLHQGMRNLRPGLRYRILWLSSPEANRLILTGAGAMLMVIALVMTMSRSGISALGVSLLLTGWFISRGFAGRSRRTAFLLYVVVLLATAVAWVGVDTLAQRFSRTNWSEFNNRRGAWLDAYGVWSSFPVTGTGMNTYAVAARFYQRHDLASFFGEAHNDYLQILAEGGLMVTVPVIACLTIVAVEIYRRGRKDVPSSMSWWLRRSAITAMVAMAIQETVEFSLQMPGNAVLFAVVCAAALHRSAEPQAEPGPPPVAHQPRLRVVASNSFGAVR